MIIIIVVVVVIFIVVINKGSSLLEVLSCFPELNRFIDGFRRVGRRVMIVSAIPIVENSIFYNPPLHHPHHPPHHHSHRHSRDNDSDKTDDDGGSLTKHSSDKNESFGTSSTQEGSQLEGKHKKNNEYVNEAFEDDITVSPLPPPLPTAATTNKSNLKTTDRETQSNSNKSHNNHLNQEYKDKSTTTKTKPTNKNNNQSQRAATTTTTNDTLSVLAALQHFISVDRMSFREARNVFLRAQYPLSLTGAVVSMLEFLERSMVLQRKRAEREFGQEVTNGSKGRSKIFLKIANSENIAENKTG
ncbi:hypothetical protein HELRODRAFT_183716 [Helobdella robusta]|uniref:Uncharacterized protein n=1 Tax=Helobdella robusta TaxID=6412 RepID=T1FK36_HELRO|nr:hypothetical protein HELRODRAFT_183716 [Helobdella robusta]ESO10345.1 hypothetical protein HELRODRAFT_183716 [Helobdella robusta]